MLVVSGCGSMKTLGPGAEQGLAEQNRISQTRCKKIPRTYSGVAYVICMSYRKEDTETDVDVDGEMVNRPGTDDSSVPGSNVLDLFLSGVIDTIVLPYTLYKQLFDGSYELNPELVEPVQPVKPAEPGLTRKDF